MPWFNVDDGFAFHRKALLAGNAALGLWVRAGSWCAQQLTEGFVPDDMIENLGTITQAKKLVKAGLWEVVDGGYQFHEWTAEGRNPTRGEVLARRAREREKKAKARAAKQKKAEESAKAQANNDCPPGNPQGSPEGIPGGIPGGVRSTTPLPSPPDSLRESVPTAVDHVTTDGAGARNGVRGPHSTTAFRLVERVLGRNLTSATKTALAIEVATLLPEVDEPTIAAALDRWNQRTGIGPRLLPGLVDDIRKEARGATTRASPTVNGTDAFAAQFLAGNGHHPPELRALPGGAS
jgi:hypothetical protein